MARPWGVARLLPFFLPPHPDQCLCRCGRRCAVVDAFYGYDQERKGYVTKKDLRRLLRVRCPRPAPPPHTHTHTLPFAYLRTHLMAVCLRRNFPARPFGKSAWSRCRTWSTASKRKWYDPCASAVWRHGAPHQLRLTVPPSPLGIPAGQVQGGRRQARLLPVYGAHSWWQRTAAVQVCGQ